jgi:hypothetical protein
MTYRAFFSRFIINEKTAGHSFRNRAQAFWKRSFPLLMLRLVRGFRRNAEKSVPAVFLGGCCMRILSGICWRADDRPKAIEREESGFLNLGIKRTSMFFVFDLRE